MWHPEIELIVAVGSDPLIGKYSLYHVNSQQRDGTFSLTSSNATHFKTVKTTSATRRTMFIVYRMFLKDFCGGNGPASAALPILQ